MKNIYILFVAAIAILAIAAGCGKPKPPERIIPSFVLRGSWYDIGRQTAYYYPVPIIKGAMVFWLFLGVGAGDARQYYRDIESVVPDAIKRQIDGLAGGLTEYWHIPAGIARDMALIWNLGIEVNARNKMTPAGCTAFAFASPDGAYLGHNTDNTPRASGTGTAFYYQPDTGENHYLSFFAPGFVGVGLGINDKGLAITYNVGRPNKDARTGLPGIFMAQQIMTKCSTLAQAVAMFQNHLKAGGHYAHGGLNFMLLDFKDKGMARVQVCSDHIKVSYGTDVKPGVHFEGCSNHFDDDFAALSEADIKDPLNVSSIARYKRLIELASSFEKYDLTACWNILTDRAGGEASNTTICRRCDMSVTTLTNIFTRDFAYYTVGVPCDYLARYGAPQKIPAAKPLISVRGTVTAGGQTLGKAELELQSLTAPDIKISTRSAPDGSYVFYNMPEGRYTLRVSKLLHVGQTAAVRCHPAAPQNMDFDLAF